MLSTIHIKVRETNESDTTISIIEETVVTTDETTIILDTTVFVETVVSTEIIETSEIILTTKTTQEKEKNNKKKTKSKKKKYYTEEDVVNLAKLLYRECGSVKSKTEQACVAWVVCNRADEDDMTITEAIKKKNQFAFSQNAPVTDELYLLASDVLKRWNNEKNGKKNVGRVLPRDYSYFHGDGTHNYFRNRFKGNYKIWDYSLDSPYEN